MNVTLYFFIIRWIISGGIAAPPAMIDFKDDKSYWSELAALDISINMGGTQNAIEICK